MALCWASQLEAQFTVWKGGVPIYSQEVGTADSVSFNFATPPVLTSMDCEYVKPGDVATINGDFFLTDKLNPMVITMPDGKEVIKFKSLTKTKVSFVVPGGCTASGPISITTMYGTVKSTKFEFNDKRGMLFNFDEGLTQQGWHSRDIITDETALDGNFVQLGNGAATMDGGWDDSNFSFEYWAGNWHLIEPYDMDVTDQGVPLDKVVDFSDYKNMALKFELFVPSANAWSAGALQVIFAGINRVQISIANNVFFRSTEVGGYGLGRGIYRPWEKSGSFSTGDKWITVTMPISEFIYNFDGTAQETPLEADDFASLTMFLVGGGVEGTECTPILKIDNIRAVPYK